MLHRQIGLWCCHKLFREYNAAQRGVIVQEGKIRGGQLPMIR